MKCMCNEEEVFARKQKFFVYQITIIKRSYSIEKECQLIFYVQMALNNIKVALKWSS